MKLLLLAAAAIPFVPNAGHCWSAPGHKAIALAAFEMLKGTPAESKLNAILASESPTNAAIWLDLVRENFRFPTPEERDEVSKFKTDFGQNEEWHFCNFIVGSTGYDFTSKYGADDDVVHALEMAITVLEGAPSKMTKLQALRSVVHLVGDIHQPLHTITGFYDLSDTNKSVLLTNVADPKTAKQDRGGNQLMYTPSQNLHHFWDLVLPDAVAQDIDSLAAKLTVASLSSQPVTLGDFHKWPEVWASSSMVQANAAYDQIKFKESKFVDDPRHPGKKKLEITIELPGGESGYKSNQTQRTEAQLKLAAVHLAQLLSKINFQ